MYTYVWKNEKKNEKYWNKLWIFRIVSIVCKILCTSNILIPTIPKRYYCDKTCVIMCAPCSLQICVLVLVHGVKTW